MKRALITGVTGQDGSYLAELLLEKGYEVHGVIRRSSSFNTERIEHIYDPPYTGSRKLTLHYGDVTDSTALNRLVRTIAPHEIYNLAAQSHVRASFDIPEYTTEVVANGTLKLLEAVRDAKHRGEDIRFYQASSSEMFGKTSEAPQNEKTPFYPRSPYGCAKVFAYWMTINYREAYGIHASNGILFNHESPRRSETFVSRKITRAVARILAGKQKTLLLGNLEARRDWGFAKDYVEAMWRMLQQPQGDDYVVATGETHTVREFLDAAFGLVGLDWKTYVRVDPRHFRPTEVDLLVGDPSKAQKQLGWSATVRFQELVRMMVVEDLRSEKLELPKRKKAA